MILIDRGSEPPELAGIRSDELTRMRRELATKVLASSLMGKAYEGPAGAFRELLWRRQHFKCCWCETKQVLRNRDVEHYRPKARADRGDGTLEDGYWWLAWTWSNLLFSCDGCNRYEKNDLFPVRGRQRLFPEQQPPGREDPWLLDPSGAENPYRHIQFRRHDDGGWWATPRAGSRYGWWTIGIVGLNRDELRDLYADHVNKYLPDALEHLEDAVALARDPTTVDKGRAKWSRHVRRVSHPTYVLAGLNYDVIDARFPARQRIHLGLELPPPGQPRSTPGAP